ncbi:MAG TPA: ParB/RepB/Spo0J family partition protein [Corynebacteriales bacterium]|nr:ParB/RepB/Spo0J family partition protein [Mycobacteriales bacterium]
MANKRQGGLGRGLAALIPTDERKGTPRLGDAAADIILGAGERGDQSKQKKAPKTAAATAAKKKKTRPVGAVYREIALDAIRPNEQQPRQNFDEEVLNELVHSIREFGLLQPIVVREIAPKAYEIIMGERRWRAAQRADLETIPAIVRQTDDSAMLRDALLENIHRVQLNPLEEAAAYQQLLEEFEVTHEELADRLGRSRPVVTNMIRLLKLPVAVQRRVAAGVLSAGHARALLGIKTGQADQESLAARIVAEGLSVRQTEEAVTLINNDGKKPKASRKTRKVEVPAEIKAGADELADHLETSVKVTMGRKRGRITIDFGDAADAQRIIGLLTD